MEKKRNPIFAFIKEDFLAPSIVWCVLLVLMIVCFAAGGGWKILGVFMAIAVAIMFIVGLSKYSERKAEEKKRAAEEAAKVKEKEARQARVQAYINAFRPQFEEIDAETTTCINGETDINGEPCKCYRDGKYFYHTCSCSFDEERSECHNCPIAEAAAKECVSFSSGVCAIEKAKEKIAKEDNAEVSTEIGEYISINVGEMDRQEDKCRALVTLLLEKYKGRVPESILEAVIAGDLHFIIHKCELIEFLVANNVEFKAGSNVATFINSASRSFFFCDLTIESDPYLRQALLQSWVWDLDWAEEFYIYKVVAAGTSLKIGTYEKWEKLDAGELFDETGRLKPSGMNSHARGTLWAVKREWDDLYGLRNRDNSAD